MQVGVFFTFPVRQCFQIYWKPSQITHFIVPINSTSIHLLFVVVKRSSPISKTNFDLQHGHHTRVFILFFRNVYCTCDIFMSQEHTHVRTKTYMHGHTIRTHIRVRGNIYMYAQVYARTLTTTAATTTHTIIATTTTTTNNNNTHHSPPASTKAFMASSSAPRFTTRHLSTDSGAAPSEGLTIHTSD